MFSLQDFLTCSDDIEDEILREDDQAHRDYHKELQSQGAECDDLLNKIDATLSILDGLAAEYEFVATNTSTLHNESEKLIQDQSQLSKINEDVSNRLHYFLQVDQLFQKLDSPTLSVSGENFWLLMNQIDEGLEFLHANKRPKDAQQYIAKYRQCLSKASTMIKNYVSNVLANASEQISKHNLKANNANSDTAFALYYGKFKAFSAKVKVVTDSIQIRRSKIGEYDRLMDFLYQTYISHRSALMNDGVDSAIKDLTLKNKNDHCALVRLSCAFLVNTCLDEYNLFYEFFPTHDVHLVEYLEGLCGLLYDNLRPCIIHINHLETLAEICSILRVEMLEEHVQHNRKFNCKFMKHKFVSI